MVVQFCVIFFISLIIIAGYGDVAELKIPNRIILAIALLFIPAALFSEMTFTDVMTHLLTGLAFLLVGFVLFSLGLFGGGDGKMLAACAIWFGPFYFLSFLLYTVLAGGVLALYVGVWSILSLEAEYGHKKIHRMLSRTKPNVPYGYAFAIGAIVVFPQTHWFSFLN